MRYLLILVSLLLVGSVWADDFNDAVFYLTVEGEAYTGAQAVPEPSALLLAFAGLLLFALQRRRKA